MEKLKSVLVSAQKLFNNIGKLNYAVGLMVIGKAKELFQYTKTSLNTAVKNNFNKSKILTKNTSEEISKEVSTSLKSLVSLKNTAKNVILASKNEFKGGFKAGIKGTVKNFRFALGRGKRLYGTLFNIAAPIVSLGILLLTIGIIRGLNFGVSIELNGEYIGAVANESVYETAQKMVQERIVYQDASDAIVFKPTYKLTVTAQNKMLSETQLTDKLILSSADAISEAYGVYVDSKFEGAVNSTAEIEAALNAKLDSYKTGAVGETVSFAQEIEFVYGYYLNNTIKEPSEITTLLNSEIAGNVYYTVEEGDTPIGIAAKNNISYNELAALNPNSLDMIYPGNELLVSASVPYLNVNVTRQETYNVNVAYSTITQTSNNYYSGYSYVSQAGKEGVNEVTANVTYTDGIETSRTVLNTTVISAPVNKVVVRGTKVASYSGSAGSGNYIWPVGGGGGYISCHYGGYAGHTGMDIATNTGTPIYAVASGTVIAVRYLNYGLGRHIMIDHGNGVVTVYGHNSVLYVSNGQRVSQGQVIALSGNTGRSTGPHLHIAFLVNGSYRNPYYYLSR
ncbi:MAG: peptidoglycan DD-metalloendopeptidase family protein [Oscillospiraceae bacterium]|nr:peptidoglycan DD-metalloendopeptidase family protein [Oscillospiraceae bacterium]